MHDDEIVRLISYRSTVTIREHLVRPEDAVVQQVDWLNPPAPVDYVPFENDQVIVGQQHYTFTLTSASSAVAHNLATTNVQINLVRRSTGVVIPNDSYTATINSANQITFSAFTVAPTGGSPVDGVITAAGPVAAFQAHTHTMAQITGLVSALDDMGERLTALEALAPVGGLALAAEATYSEKWELPPYINVTPILGDSSKVTLPATVGEIQLTTLPKFVPSLFGAVHTATTYTLPVTAGKVAAAVLADARKIYVNNSGAAVTLPLSSQLVSEDDQFGFAFSVPAGGFASHDGKTWVPMVQYGASAEKTYYCRLYEQTLWEDTISAEQLSAGRHYEVQFATAVRTLAANSLWHWNLVIELAALTSDSSPATTGGNLAAAAWVATPVLAQRLVVSPTTREYTTGYRVIRAAGGSLTAEKLAFGNWTAATAPAAAEFAIRARLVRADCVNAVAAPRGYLAVSGFAATAEGSSANVGMAKVSK